MLGLSPIAYARESIGLGIAAEQFGSKFFKNGTHLGGIIEDPGVLGDTQYERARSQFSTMFKGLQNSHGVAILEKGAKFHPIGIPPEDAQFLETRKYQRTEIAALYRVPLHLIGDLEHATFSNIEHQDLSYLQRSLLPWLVRIEQAMQTGLLTSNERRRLLIEHDTGSFLRGDTKSRMEAYSTAIQNGVMSPNEARMKENMNPVEGGDVILLPLNMRPADDPGGDPPDEPLDTKRALRSPFVFGGKQRAVDYRSNAVVDGRWALTEKIIEAFEVVLQRLLTDQAAAVKAIVDRVYGLRSAEEIASLRELIKGVFLSYFDNPPKFLKDAIYESASLARLNAYAEAGLPDLKDAWYESFVTKYTRDLSKRINGQSYGELIRLLDKVEATGGNVPDAVYNKIAGWGKSKYKRVAETEGTRISCAIVTEVLIRSGFEIIWASNPSCCEACRKLNGSKISQGEGSGGLNRHPPLHNGCKCTVKAGRKLDKPAKASNIELAKYDQADTRLRDPKWLKSGFPSQDKL
ncbi:MAG: phage portal protein, partial [Clostridia bacterium]|nr:phage portal protein [Clostridia bacterium]